MKSFFYLLAALLFAAVLPAAAAPGDTTWVQANNRRLDNGNGYGNYDTAVRFPNTATSYRKIFMIFTLGEYDCPAGTQYCHQWDYTVTNFILTPTDTFEVSRLITPYANSGVPRFPSTWTKDYVFDVTDFYPKLSGNAVSRIFYSGYSAGFTANVRFAFIEGTPERNVLGMSRLWNGSWLYGKSSDLIDSHVTAKTNTAPNGTNATALKFTITGHGSDNNGCCEFASHNYAVKVNSTTTETRAIWRDNCGVNPLYPQGGTWIYDRANWCPGDLIYPATHWLPGITPGNAFTTDVDFDAYTAGNTNYGSYTIDGMLFFYGPMNFAHNVAVEDIIAPTVADEHYRENPSGSTPVIRIRNKGSDSLIGISIRYGVKDSAQLSFAFNGKLAPQHDTILKLPALNTLTNLSTAGATGTYQFTVELVPQAPFTDGDLTDNKLTSTFAVAPVWPADLVISMKTNNQAAGGVSETSWAITDMNNNVIASRTNAAINTQYADTVALRSNGFYKLTITDAGCDGLHWWPYDPASTSGITAGTFTVKRVGSAASIPMKGYNYSGTFNNDFGCSFTQYFTTKGWALGVHSLSAAGAGLQVYPNPATDQCSILVEGLANTAGDVALLDMTGRVLQRQPYAGGIQQISLGHIPSGVYQVVYTSARQEVRLNQKLVITR